jgi:hypothetical protein
MDDETFINEFESCKLPYEAWTHRAHVKVAYLYLSKLPYEDARERVRKGIKRYNASKAIPESPTSGYNETTTCAFFHLVAATRNAYGPEMSVTDADSFCDFHPQLMSSKVLRLFYSPERRMHPDAKTIFVEPDLTALPALIGTGR